MAAVKSNIQIKIGPFFGIPVNVITAVDDDKKSTGLNVICDTGHDPTRVRQDLKCPECSNNDKATFKKGQERPDGTIAIVDAEAVAAITAIPDEVKSTLTLTSHPVEQVAEHTLPSGKVYYLEPGKGGADAYPLLVQMIKARPNLSFVTVWAPRTAPSMYRLGLFGDVLTLTQLAWPASVKATPNVKTDFKPDEVKMACVLADQLASDFDPETFRDTRTETLAAFIAAADGVEGSAKPVTAAVAPKVSSMMDMLAAAVAASSAPAVADKPKRAPRAKKPAVTELLAV